MHDNHIGWKKAAISVHTKMHITIPKLTKFQQFESTWYDFKRAANVCKKRVLKTFETDSDLILLVLSMGPSYKGI